jgi:hypothetical protein
MKRKSLKSQLPEHSPDYAVWQRLQTKLDAREMGDYGLPAKKPSDSVWSRLDEELEKTESVGASKMWLRAAAAVVLLLGIASAFYLHKSRTSVRHEVVIAEVSHSFSEKSEISASELLEGLYIENENSEVNDLMAELKQLEEDKRLILQKMKTDDSQHMQQLLMEIELDMAALVREISNELR